MKRLLSAPELQRLACTHDTTRYHGMIWPRLCHILFCLSMVFRSKNRYITDYLLTLSIFIVIIYMYLFLFFISL